MASSGDLSSSLTALGAVDRVFGAIGDRVHVAGGASDRVAGSKRKGRPDERNCGDFLEHVFVLSSLTEETNAAFPKRLHSAENKSISRDSNGYGRRDMRVRIIILEREVLRLIIEQALPAILDDPLR